MKSFPERIGTALAHIQHLLDRVTTWGFERMKEAGEVKGNPKRDRNQYVRGLKKAGRLTLRFLGTAGDAYYRTYEDLKKGKKSKQ